MPTLHFVGWELPDAIQQLITPVAEKPDAAASPTMSPELEAQILEVLAQDDAAASAPEAVSAEDTNVKDEPLAETDEPAIRVMKPIPFPADGTSLDEVQTAIVQAKTQPTSVIHSAFSQKRTFAAIGQSCVGELTGSISGNVWCYGYAIHEGICVFVNMGGPRMAVEAIRAKFGKGEIVNCAPWDAPAVELTAGEGNSGMYHDFVRRGKRS